MKIALESESVILTFNFFPAGQTSNPRSLLHLRLMFITYTVITYTVDLLHIRLNSYYIYGCITYTVFITYVYGCHMRAVARVARLRYERKRFSRRTC